MVQDLLKPPLPPQPAAPAADAASQAEKSGEPAVQTHRKLLLQAEILERSTWWNLTLHVAHKCTGSGPCVRRIQRELACLMTSSNPPAASLLGMLC